MPIEAANYFRYFPTARAAATWGFAVTAAGFTSIRPNTPYPPTRHPADHHFEWEKGRILEALQIVLITSGQGQFESKGIKPQVIKAGNAFILFPGVWHRYRPDPAVGWGESWVELRGATINRLLRQKVFTHKSPVLRGALSAELDLCLEAVHARARQPRPGFDPELATRGLAVLAAWEHARFAPHRQTRMARAVAEAERYISDNLAMPVNVPQLARNLGVAYSQFRKEFKTFTGYSPWQYMLHLRLAQARRVLASSDATLEEIASRIGFSSAFHLSAAFKQAYAVAPAHWRRQFLAESKWPGSRPVVGAVSSQELRTSSQPEPSGRTRR